MTKSTKRKTKSKTKTKKSHKRSHKRKVKVKKVPLVSTSILHVKVPPHITPIVALHPARGVVEIVPVPKKKKWSWGNFLFGDGGRS